MGKSGAPGGLLSKQNVLKRRFEEYPKNHHPIFSGT